MSDASVEKGPHRIFDENGYLSGSVVKVESSGLIELDDGTSVYLWRLHSIDVDEVAALLPMGRYIVAMLR